MGTFTWVFLIAAPVMICALVITMFLMSRVKREPVKHDS
jgi:ABC-type bacteriocin/lantibiotic exporter with double-glycine peptidase domain